MERRRIPIIEILVGIGVLIGLYFVLWPVFAPRPLVRVPSCLHNLREISICIYMYAQDNEGVYFPDKKTLTWSSSVLTYAPSISAWACPNTHHQGQPLVPDYGFNANLYGQKFDAIANVANVITLADITDTGRNNNFSFTSSTPPDDRDFAQLIAPRHNGAFFYACLDGHASSCNVRNTTISQAVQRDFIILTPTITKATAP